MLLRKLQILGLLFIFFWGGSLEAQALTHIKEDASVTAMRRKRADYRESSEYRFEGYSIFVNIFSNRKEAIKFEKEFNHRFKGNAHCQIIYDEPNFKIYAGSYTLKAEAEYILAKVRQAYPSAKIIRMPMSIPN